MIVSRFILFLPTLFASLAHPSLGLRVSADQIIKDFNQLPVCGINCTLPVLVGIGCNLSDPVEIASRLCTNEKAETTIVNCLFANCNNTQTVEVEKIQYDLCYGEPRSSRQANLLGATGAMTALVIMFVVARCWSRYTISKQFWWDDWLLLCSTVCFLVMPDKIGLTTSTGVWMGIGLHVWNVNPDHDIKLYAYFWLSEILYVVVSMTTKLSVLVLYSRIFAQYPIRIGVYVGYGWLATHTIILCSLVIFQCNPVSQAYDKSLGGKCHDLNPMILGNAVISIFENIFVIVLPIPSLLKLNLSWERKIGVVLVMSVGLIAVVSSMVRMKFVIRFSYSVDIFWDSFGIDVLSAAELSLSILCVCFPAIRLLISHTLRDTRRNFRENRPLSPVNLSDPSTGWMSMGSAQYSQFKTSSCLRWETTSTGPDKEGAPDLRPVSSLPPLPLIENAREDTELSRIDKDNGHAESVKLG